MLARVFLNFVRASAVLAVFNGAASERKSSPGGLHSTVGSHATSSDVTPATARNASRQPDSFRSSSPVPWWTSVDAWKESSTPSPITSSGSRQAEDISGSPTPSWTGSNAKKDSIVPLPVRGTRSVTADSFNGGSPMSWSTSANNEAGRKSSSESSQSNLSSRLSVCLRNHGNLTARVEYEVLIYDPKKITLPANTTLSCSLSIVVAANKRSHFQFFRAKNVSTLCSKENYIVVRYSGYSIKHADCGIRRHEKYTSITNSMDVVLVAGEPEIAISMTIYLNAWEDDLETGKITAFMGFIQTPGFGLRTTYPPKMDSWVKIPVTPNHVTLLSYLQMQVTDCYEFSGDSVGLYAGGKYPSNKVWEKCATAEPLPEVYVAPVLYVRFISSDVNNEMGFKLLYSFHEKPHRPVRVSGGLWNCSVPQWPEIQLHFQCNLKEECDEGQDELSCFYSGPCGQGYLSLGNRCYLYIYSDDERSWKESNLDCKRRGGFLVSLNTPKEWQLVVSTLKTRAYPRPVFVGQEVASKTFPFMYTNTLVWADDTMAYYTDTSFATASGCGSFDDKQYVIDATSPCHTRFRHDRLCELESMSGVHTDDKPIRAKSPYNLPRPQNASFPTPVATCPRGHLTHAFLACDEQSVCWSSRHAYRESEAWGAPSKASCPAPTTSLPPMFVCSSGVQRVPYSLVCDHGQHCSDDSDESFCVFPPCAEAMMFCSASAQCVKESATCDGKFDCTDKTDEEICDSGSFIKDHHFVPLPAVVDMIHSRDLSSSYDKKPAYTLTPISQSDQTAGSYLCPETHFQCADNGYCLPLYLRCNSINDCPGREDEAGCGDGSAACPGFYRCRSSNVCLHPSHVCDSVYQCPQHDDELLCHLICPAGCTCHGLAFTCPRAFSVELHSELKFLDASGSGLTPARLTANTLLVHLSLSACRLVSLGNMTFPNLRSLDLSLNHVESISTDDLRGMLNLQYLVLSQNPLKSLFSLAKKRVSFPTMRKLDISGVMLQRLRISDLASFPGLFALNLSHCGISEVLGESFVTTLSLLRVLDAAGCPMTHFSRDLLSAMDQLRDVRADNYKLCCPDTLPSGFKQDNCRAPFDEVSSCQSLLRSDLYRVCLYIFCGLALVGNCGCFLLRCFRFKSSTSGFGVFVTHLTVADFLMGVYLGIIGAADRTYRATYLWQDVLWRHSVACSLAGYLSLLSSEVSALIICLITLDRFLVLRFPFSSLHFQFRSAHTTCAVVWLIGVLMAAVPLTPRASHWSFYSHTGICIPLPVTRKAFAGDRYAFGIIIVFNFVLFFFIAVGQGAIYASIRANSLSGADTTKKSTDLRIARRLITVAASDFLCWFPIGLMGLLASRGVPVPSEVNVGMAILVLPLNSSLNPFLYTINVILERQRRSRDDLIMKQLMARMSDDDPK